jgi:CheY-like chemotaxis protein
MEYNRGTMVPEESKRILIADDDEFFRVQISDLLTEAGHEVKCVSDGRGVIEELQGNSDGFALLLLDLQMPYIDGYEVLEWMRDNSLAGRFPVLAVTGVYDPTHILKRLKNLGAVDLITKALSSKQVVHKANRLLFPEIEPRGKPRIPISIPVNFTLESTALKGNLLNLNESGLFLHTTEELRANAGIQLTFTLPGYDMLLNLKGVVRWYRCLLGENRLFGGAGISFLYLSHKAEAVIQQFVRKERHRLGLQE